MNECSKVLSHPTYRADIDGLRAIAVLLVMGFHIFPEICKGGFVGVDVFFVISGYLITTIIIQNRINNSFSFLIFYARRIRRILPALLLVLVTSYLFALFSLYAPELVLFKKYLMGGSLFVSNFVSWAESGYFDVSSYKKPLLHLWSLGVEEQFYLFWPVILIAAAYTRVSFFLSISLLIVLSFFINICIVYSDTIAAFYSPITRFWELMCGGLLASIMLVGKGNVKVPPTVGNCLSFTGLALLFTAVVVINKDDDFPGYWALLPVFASVLIIAAGNNGQLNKIILANPVLVSIGLISYPLYLWHWPLISFFSIVNNGMPTIVMRCGIVLVAFVLAWLTYNLIEKPIKDKKDKTWKIPVVPMLLVSSLCLGIFASLSYFQISKTHGRGVASKVFSHEMSAGKVFLLGDSHAEHFLTGLSSEFRGEVINETRYGCIPFYNLDTYNRVNKNDRCIKAYHAIYEAVEKNWDVNVVVIGSMGPVYLTGLPFQGTGLSRVEGLGLRWGTDPTITDRWQMYELAMRDSLKRLLSYNKKVIFFIDIPELGMDPKYCMPSELVVEDVNSLAIPRQWADCKVDRLAFDNRTKRYRELIYRVTADFPAVVVFDPTDLFCDQKVCNGVRDGKVLYKDSDHLSDEGSVYVAKYLVKKISEQLIQQ